MNISTLAKKVNMKPDQLYKEIERLGYRVRRGTMKISDKKAKEIVKKLERISKEKAREEEELVKLDKERKSKKRELPPIVKVKDMAEILDVPVTTIIKELMKSGIMANLNEEIDYETAAIIAEDLGFSVSEKKEETEAIKDKGIRSKLQAEFEKADKADLKDRPPIVTVMGHVDHGKTTLLDAIRETNVVEGEKGGITQHIGAYQVKEKGKLVTFLDTPGHEAFSLMRERGAKVTDIAILIVAADDGVQPQTEEAIAHINNAKIPMIVAINKIDKPEANVDKLKQELANKGISIEEYGGETIAVEISAKQKKNINKLLEMILLVSEVEELKANPEDPGVGTIIEANKDPQKGVSITAIVQNGTLKLGDIVTCGTIFGKIKAMENDQGKRVDHAKPATPVKVWGLHELPEVGDIIQAEESKTEAMEKINQLKKICTPTKVCYDKTDDDDKSVKKLNVIIKVDVQGSSEAILEEISKIKSDEVMVRIVNIEPGKVTESDVMTADSTNAKIYGFNTSITSVANRLVEDKKIDYKEFNVIYELVDEIKEELSGMLEQKVRIETTGTLEVLKVFRTERKRKVIGGKVTTGKLILGGKIRIKRESEEIGEGKIVSLQANKTDVKEVTKGKECGLAVETKTKIAEEDKIEVIEEIVEKAEL